MDLLHHDAGWSLRYSYQEGCRASDRGNAPLLPACVFELPDGVRDAWDVARVPGGRRQCALCGGFECHDSLRTGVVLVCWPDSWTGGGNRWRKAETGYLRLRERFDGL